MPKVSIAIPTRNRSAYLKLAVASALGQSLSSIEVVVSDNASDDNTQEVLRGIQDQRLVCIRQDRPLTMAENWNCCLQHATGEYFLLLSDDDFLETDAIQEMAAVFEQGSLAGNIPAEQIGIVHCATAIVDAEGRLQETLRPHAPISAGCEIVESFLRRRFTLFPCAVLLRRNDLVNLGGIQVILGPRWIHMSGCRSCLKEAMPRVFPKSVQIIESILEASPTPSAWARSVNGSTPPKH